MPSLHIDKLHDMALALQNKLAKLAGAARDTLISEIKIRAHNANQAAALV
jgi:hypothetical protein